MKSVKNIFLSFILFFLMITSVSAEDNKVTLYLFYGEECPHCAEEKEFLKELQERYDELNIELYEVWHDENNQSLMNEVKTKLNQENPYIPFTVVGDTTITGFNSSMKDSIEDMVQTCMERECSDVVSLIKNGQEITNIISNHKEQQTITLPFVGKINSENVSLPILAILLGFVDGFNPCAMWILLFLIGMLIGNKDKKKLLLLGCLFLGTSAFVYALFMVSWLKIVLTIEQVGVIRLLIAMVAIVGAGWNLYSYYQSTKKETGCQVVNSTKRKKIMTKIKKFVGEKNLFLASMGIIALAISVNFIELACSAGWPLVFTEILALHKLNAISYGFYIFLYILFYLLDDLIIFIIAVSTFKITGISNKYSKYSHLIGGILMLIIGILMLFKPEWLMLNFS